MPIGGSSFWVYGKWGSGASDTRPGETSYKLNTGCWMTFYAGSPASDLYKQYVANGDVVYIVSGSDRNFNCTLDLTVQATGLSVGKIDFHDADGKKYDTIDVHGPTTWQQTLPMNTGYSVHVKCSSST